MHICVALGQYCFVLPGLQFDDDSIALIVFFSTSRSLAFVWFGAGLMPLLHIYMYLTILFYFIPVFNEMSNPILRGISGSDSNLIHPYREVLSE